ncbi:energy transducer TonB [Hymenobacter chitinivorans]|uniref:Protein TonB n=1 Tax=Hymenobacter chitinivorans DSM 11115 TaxID=1121954 RepID=A0A2M9B523_9BACT|nr:energy transducer TonB [Hymenobacter chitinivorans]PJJ53052.1 protein TonB [Hymenobacter chitinivorans DSM 11115]
MLALPLLNVRLNACSEDWQQMTPTAQGRHCRSCDREVVDLTAATHADLLVARAASPDGRVCGRLRREQLAPAPRLGARLRRFVVALVLVCGLGLTSGEAWAQVRKATTAHKPAARKPVTRKPPPDVEAVTELSGDLIIDVPEPEPVAATGPKVYTYVEQMPQFKDGGWAGLLDFIKRNQQWPAAASVEAEGKVFVKFIIDKTGPIRDAEVLKSPDPTLNAEALRLVQLLDGKFVPGRQNGQAVDVYYTIPVTFQIK